MSVRARVIEGLIAGMLAPGRVLVGPGRRNHKIKRRPSAAVLGQLNDRDAIRGDFAAVGDDMRAAVEQQTKAQQAR